MQAHEEDTVNSNTVTKSIPNSQQSLVASDVQGASFHHANGLGRDESIALTEIQIIRPLPQVLSPPLFSTPLLQLRIPRPRKKPPEAQQCLKTAIIHL